MQFEDIHIFQLIKQNGNRSVVAHRGASGYLPEHTLEAYTLAHSQGADYIEPDVILTRDNVLVCLHDLALETTTDVAARFPDRKRADGHWYTIDFTLAELKQLSVFGRVKAAERETMQGYQIATLDELIHLVQRLNKAVSRRTALLIETKDPDWHAKQGKPLEPVLKQTLARHKVDTSTEGYIIQSFDDAHLKCLRDSHNLQLPLMWLTGELPSVDKIDDMRAWANGINPHRSAIEEDGKPNTAGLVVLERMHSRGMKMFVWTFNDEPDVFRRFLERYGVDGVITNNPDAGVRAVAAGRKAK
ncbi:MAG: glycerophosphodiester phosphodiesterase family protein [Armatimonadota bacterium]